MTKVKKKWVKLFLILLLGITSLMLLLSIIVYTKQDELVQQTLTSLNEDFEGRISLEGSHISPFVNFPYISVDLEQLQIYEGKTDSSDLLLAIKDTYVGFNLWSIVSGNFDIKKVRLENGYIKLVQHKDGSFNIVNAISQSSEEPEEKDEESMHLDLQSIELVNVDLLKINEENNLLVEALIEESQAKIQSNDSLFIVDFNSSILFNLIIDQDTSFIHDKHLEIRTAFEYNLHSNSIQLQPSELQIEKAVFNTEGGIDLEDHVNLDLHFSGNKPNFDLFLAFAPPELQPVLERYDNGGKIYFDARVKGKSIDGFSPAISVDFGCEDAFIENSQVDKSVDDLFFEGHFTNGEDRSPETMELVIKDFRARPATGLFKGNVVVSNFRAPEFDIQLISEFDLDFLSQFLGIRNLENISGKVALEMNFHDIIDLSQPEKSIERLNESYFTKLKVTDLNVNSSVYPIPVSNLNIEAEMDGHKALIRSLSGKLGNSDISLKASISDLPAIIHHTDLPVEADLEVNSNFIDLAELTQYTSDSSQGFNEQINDLSVHLQLKSSAKAFTESPNLPIGEFFVNELHASLTNYPHELHDFNADILIDSVDFNVIDFTGMLDESDFHFNGTLSNYDLWFMEDPIGTTQLDFNLYSDLIQLEDLFSYGGENYVPEDYRHEEFSKLKLHALAVLDFNHELISSRLSIDTLETKMKIHPMRLTDVSGELIMDSVQLKVNNFAAQLGQSDINVNARFYFNQDSIQINHEFHLESRALNFDELFSYEPPKKDEMTPADHEDVFNVFELPFTDMNYSFDLNKLTYHRYRLNNFYASGRMKENHYLYIDTLGVKAAGGEIQINGYFNGSDPKLIYFSPTIRMNQVDLDQLLFKFENFGQDHLVSENLHGKLSGELSGKIHVHADLVPIIDDSEIHLNLNVLNGSLTNYSALEALSEYFSDKNLSNVRFDTLKNQLDIQDGKIMIPKMDINSSLGYFEISGEQSVDMDMEYYVSVPLKVVTKAGFSKLFSSKKENTNQQVDEIKNREDYKNSPFLNLKIQGNPDHYKVSLGKKKEND